MAHTQDTRIALVERNYEILAKSINDNDQKLCDRLDRMECTIEKLAEAFDRALNGNGKPGVLERIQRLEQVQTSIHNQQEHDADRLDIAGKRMDEIEKQRAEEAGGRKTAALIWTRVHSIIAVITALIAASAAYVLKKG